MTAESATRILLNRKRTTAKLRKQCARARETSMRSETPIYKDYDEKTGMVEYFSSKPGEVTPEQRLALKLRRATREQLLKWTRRNLVREAACSGIAERIDPKSPTAALRRREAFVLLAAKHDLMVTACLAEIDRRKEEVAMRAELKAENV